MFFIGIFGIDRKQKEIGHLPNLSCKSCTHTSIHLIKQYNCFHFFFIPIFKWHEIYFAECNQCNSLYEIPIEKGKAFEQKQGDISYWDLKSLKLSSPSCTCSFCGKDIEEDFVYCPYCGKCVKD